MELQRGSALAETPCKGGIASTKYAVALYSPPAAGIDNGLERLKPRTPYEEAGADGSHSWDGERNVNRETFRVSSQVLDSAREDNVIPGLGCNTA
jgi:hypothetical protein